MREFTELPNANNTILNMPLIHLQALSSESKLAVWRTEESFVDLAEILIGKGRRDLLPPDSFSNEKRRMEWLSTRCALLQMNNDEQENIFYNEKGKPYLLSGKGHISISHAWPFVCLFIQESRSVGVDIERMTDRIFKIAPRFINEKEFEWLSAPLNIRELYLIWAAKEAVFKMKGGGGIDFRLHLTVQRTALQTGGIAKLIYSKNGAEELLNIYYQFLDSMIVVYTIANDSSQ